MGSLYRLNSLFEFEISNSLRLGNKNNILLERSKVYEYLFLAISQKGDFTLFSEPCSKEILDYWKESYFEYGKVIVTDNFYYADSLELNVSLPMDTFLVEWGKTSRFDYKKNTLVKNKAKIRYSLNLNSKINQTRWKDSIGENKLTSIICVDKNELDFCLSKFSYPFVIKPEFGFSGITNMIIRDQNELKRKYNKILELMNENKNGIILEEWVGEKKKKDFSGLFELSSKKYKFLTTTRMLLDKSGIYRGTIIEKDSLKEFEQSMENIVISHQRFSSLYKGNISMDGFTFIKNGVIETQTMSEINFRYSMGRILFELNKKLDKEAIYNSALLFYPIKKKITDFKSIVISLDNVKQKYNISILLLTPIFNSKRELNSFVGIYASSIYTISPEILDEIKTVFG